MGLANVMRRLTASVLLPVDDHLAELMVPLA
jgi:hypothetical protein